MFTLLYHLQALRWALPTAIMLGSAPTFFVTWFGWRALTSVLPQQVYNRGDAAMYNFYQSLILFFFESLSGVEVCLVERWAENVPVQDLKPKLLRPSHLSCSAPSRVKRFLDARICQSFGACIVITLQSKLCT